MKKTQADFLTHEKYILKYSTSGKFIQKELMIITRTKEYDMILFQKDGWMWYLPMFICIPYWPFGIVCTHGRKGASLPEHLPCKVVL